MAAQPDIDTSDADPAADLASSHTPDDDHDPEGRLSLDDQGSPSELPQPPPKRKGGRKPVYATVEERKQRNRQAQAAFRERRTEYIKQLEVTLKDHEQQLRDAQNDKLAADHERSALRYKLAALEKIIAEKGIDVEAELQAKADGPDLHPSAFSPAPKAKANALPLSAAPSPHFPPQRNVRGLAPKLDLRSKMIQLQANNASSSDRHGLQTLPWQHSSPVDQLEGSPGGVQFRGIPSPVSYDMSTQIYSVQPGQKAYDLQQQEQDLQQMQPGAVRSPFGVQDLAAMPQDPSLRGHAQQPISGPENYDGFGMAANAPGMGKMGNFEFY